MVVESKVKERLEQVNRNGDELRRIRLRVRGVISGDAELMGIVQQGVHFDTDSETNSSHVQEGQYTSSIIHLRTKISLIATYISLVLIDL